MIKKLSVIFYLALLSACTLLQPPTEAPPSATATPEPISSPTATREPTQVLIETGRVSGRVCYPSEFIPEMTVYFFDVETEQNYHFLVAENQDAYEVELPAGTFLAFAYRSETLVGGGYTAYVASGYDESVTDHSLLEVEVASGSVVTGIDICDWVLTDLPLPEMEGEMPGGGTDPLAGLVYRTPDGLWIIEPTGVHKLVMDDPDALVLSAEGYAYSENDDIWLYDAVSPRSTNLTGTADRIETLWTGDSNPPGALLFASYPVDFELGPGVTGFLTFVNLDSTGYEVLDDENQVWSFDVAPDGVRVAYGLGRTGWIYDLSTGERTGFDPAVYGLDEIASIGSPAWSPDGSRISWVVGFEADGGSPFTFGLAVFDLAAGTGTILHPHELPGMDGYPPPAVWRPDGEWLVYNAFDADFERGGLWLLNTDGAGEIHLGQGGAPVWRPDGGGLVYLDSSTGFVRYFDPISLETTVLDFSDKNTQPVAWLP